MKSVVFCIKKNSIGSDGVFSVYECCYFIPFIIFFSHGESIINIAAAMAV